MKVFTLLAGLLSGALFVSGLNAEDTVELKLKLPVGKKFEREVKTAQTVAISIQGSPQPLKESSKRTQKIVTSVVKELAEGGRVVDIEILSGDESDPFPDEDDILTGALAGMENKKYTCYLNADYEVEKVEGLKEVLEGLEGEKEEGQQSMFGDMFSEDSLKELCAECFTQGLPDKPVKKGDTWTHKMEMSLDWMGTITTDATYTLAGFQEYKGYNCAVIDYEGTLTGKASDKAGPMGMVFNVTDGTLTGKILFSPEQGTAIGTSGGMKINLLIDMMGAQSTASATQKTISKLINISDIETDEE